MQNNNPSSPPRFLGTFGLAMLTVSAIISLRNLPTNALLGSQIIVYILAAAFTFFIPVALACAELAAGWPRAGGVYLWVKEAFGSKLGFLALWLQWAESVVWLPSPLSFLAATTAYLFNPCLEKNKYFLISLMLTYLWGTTLLNFRGLKTASKLSSLGVVLGSLLPAAILIALGFHYLASPEHVSVLTLNAENLQPIFDSSSFATFTAILLGLCGMEITAYHVQNAKNPQRGYPRAMFLATFLIVAISVLGALIIAMVIPKAEISLVAGPMQAFNSFFNRLGLSSFTPVLAALTLIGGLALLNAWIIGPCKGLLASAEEGHLPKSCQKINKAGVPTTLLYAQALIGTLFIAVFVFIPSIQGAYWIVNILAAQLYLIMYFILFISLIKLHYSHPQVPRPYRIPGGKFGVWLVGLLGASSTLTAIVVGFIKPADIDVAMSQSQYASMLGCGIFIFTVPPMIFLNKQRLHKRKRENAHA